ncbi:uncharacterized protein LOC127839235 [Dreissena polymorpha]|uniref:B box-type domain-containing protein n=1 Tax=Dreissena polymorpha TaxID=45954 RepID=A0A9D4F9C5_DREPO|nr:uncharacterized protein LOC127839235 [Dreissena polymorpha]KAH3794784.1 hypothetical protein DPMN_148322 [Dreissena polymorpha]
MATGSFPTVEKRSPMVEGFCSTSLEERNFEEYADMYCETSTVSNKEHTTFGRGDIQKWSGLKEAEDFIRKCFVHKDKTLTLFCNDHIQLCCSYCVETNHSQCSKVTPIDELSNMQSTDLQGLSVELETVLGKIKSLMITQEASVQSLQATFKEHEAFLIDQMLVKINTAIYESDIISVSMSDENEQYIREEMCSSVLSILNAFDKSSVNELIEMKEEVTSLKESITYSINKCTDIQNALTQYCDITKTIGSNKELCFILRIKSQLKIRQALSVLGKLDHVLTVTGKSAHNTVTIPSDSTFCIIEGLCVLPDGEILVVDSQNKKVKLLNQQYQVVSHLDVPTCHLAICQITPNRVAVAMDDNIKTHEVQFITVFQSQLVAGRKFQLQHDCFGIAHHQGDLYIAGGTALYKYTLGGKLVSRLYQERTRKQYVMQCVVSPTGDKLYISNRYMPRIITLTRDGTVLAIFKDPDFGYRCNVNVTPAGQVLVCLTCSIIQVDSEGRRKLATLAKPETNEGVWQLRSVCYSSTASSIIVGPGDEILVFKVE